MKRKLLSLLVLLFCIMGGANAKDLYDFVLGEEMTLTEAAASETGFVLVSNNQILGIEKDGDAGLKMYDINDVAIAYMVKLESISDVTGVSETEPNAYHVLFYKPNATKIEAGSRYGIWGNPNCALTAVSWGDTWVAPFNGDKPDGRDFDYSSRWNFELQEGGGYAVYFNNPDEKNPNAKKYLNGGGISDNLQKVWHLHPITKQKVGHTTFDLTKISFEEAKVATNPVVMIQNDLVLCNSDGGANYSTKEDFDEFAYWVKFEEYSAENNQYYITLNKEDGAPVNYLNASEWSHIFLSGVDKEGTNGEKQNGAVFIIANLGDNKYSIRNLGAVESAYGEDKVNEGYVNLTTSGHWENNATWRNTNPGEWEFYTVTNKKDVLDDPEPEPEPWICPEGETDITTLPWVKNAQDCIIDFGKDKGNIFGTDAGGDNISYVDVSNYGIIKVYGAPGSVVRAFINREEAAAESKDFTFVFNAIGNNGVAIFNLYKVFERLGDYGHIYLSGIKAGPNHDSKATVYGITVSAEKPEDYKELPISDLVETGSATVNGEVIDMTNGGGAKWQYDTPQNWSAYKYLVITPKRRFVTSAQKEGGADAEGTAVQVSINGKSLQWIGEWNPKRLWVLDLTTTKEGLDLTTVTDKITSVEIHYGNYDKGEWSLSAAYLTNTKPTYSESLYDHKAGALGDAETNADHVRTLSATGTLGVVCLPYASAICGADAYEFVGVNDSENPTAIWVKPVTGILAAGKPYVFKTNTNLNVTFYKAGANTVAEAGRENGLVGVLADTPVTGNNYAVSGGKFKKAGEYTATVKANRAYLDIANVPVYTNPSSVKGCINLYDENEADAIQSIIKPANEGAIYDLSGRRVSNAKAGLYIVNGKKVVLK